MDNARWERAQFLFHQAAALPPAGHRAYLESECGTDDHLVNEVLAMLAEDARSGSLLDRDMAYAADPIVHDATQPAPARRFGPYHLVRVLGEGGAGVVYLGARDDLGSVAAIKILRDAWLSPARRERFAVEQRILARLNHPFVARLYDADILADGTPWFAMEYIDGLPITDYCRRTECAMPERIRLFEAVCAAVQYAHRQLIVHRDLKPSNILVTATGVVKLLDFGVSKELEEPGTTVPATVTAVRLMTPAYASPEQIRGAAGGVQSDVYSLGVILYELLTGTPPFDLANRSPSEAEQVILASEPAKPSSIAAAQMRAAFGRHAPTDLDTLCLTAMHKDSRCRYGSVEALARDVEHFRRCEPLEARLETSTYRAGKFIRRNSRRLAATAAILGLVVSLVVISAVRLRAARNVALAEAVRSERIQRFMLTLFDGGEREAGPAADLRVLTLIDRGLLHARALEREPLVQADLYDTLGGIYRMLGNLDRADSVLRSSLEMRRALSTTDPAGVVKALVGLAALRSDQARFDEAERLAREALAVAKSRPRARDAVTGIATAALGQVLEQRGDYAQARSVLEEAVRLQSGDAGDETALAATLYELANTHFYAGNLDLAESTSRRVLAMHRRLFGDRHPLVAGDLINLGAVQHERGQYVEAERFYRDALDINRAWYGNGSYKTASNLTMLGRSLVFRKRYEEADGLLREAVRIHEQVFGPAHPRVASALNDLGNTAMQRGDVKEAETAFRRIGEIYRSVYGDSHYLVAIALSNLAGVLMARQEFSAAEQMYRDAVRRFANAQSAEHLNTGIARIKLGRALLRQQKYSEAESETFAGYTIVSKQAAPTVSWLTAAREDLATIYDAQHQVGRAESIRAEAARLSQLEATNRPRN